MDVDPRVAAVLAGTGSDVELELIEGDLFTSAPPTAYLGAVIAGVAEAVRDGLAAAGFEARVVVEEPLQLGPRTVVRPDVAVLAPEQGAPALVVEVRSESTDRYALGPKRMAYARGLVSEYWFVDPRHERVLALCLSSSERDYAWPGQEAGPGDLLVSAAIPGLRLEARALLGARAGAVMST